MSKEYPECSGEPASCPENEGHGCCKTNPDITAPGVDGNHVFTLVRECESAIRKLGWRSNDYQLSHEARTLAERYEIGDFRLAREWIRKKTESAAPGGDVEHES